MTSPSKALDQAIAGVSDFFTSKNKKSALTYDSGKTLPSVTYKKPKLYQYTPSNMPKGTVFGSNGPNY